MKTAWDNMPPAFRPSKTMHRVLYGHSPTWKITGEGSLGGGGGEYGEVWKFWRCTTCDRTTYK